MIGKNIQSNYLKYLSLTLMIAMIIVLVIFYNHSNIVAAQNPKISLDAPVSFPVDI